MWQSGLPTVVTYVYSAAAPIFDTNARVQAALSIVVPSIRANESKLENLAKEVMSTAHNISQALGYKAPRERKSHDYSHLQPTI